ncbi:cell division protein FtsB [Desulfovibrio litoralis DSM 11393]|uniref:Cell division protein FtsB n=2 Tax=Desulfovibrio litoralis TaxID=466107 RepID=A0A1M7THA1_9BACT|nr:cell division protein FtsB [Desulfovibrio litoralis DSM 11393]
MLASVWDSRFICNNIMVLRQIFLAISLMINLVLVYKLVWSDDGIIAYQAMKQKYLVLQQKVKDLDEKNLLLSQEIRFLQTDGKYLEMTIRKRLNFVKENELLYIFSDNSTAADKALNPGAEPNESKN